MRIYNFVVSSVDTLRTFYNQYRTNLIIHETLTFTAIAGVSPQKSAILERRH